MLKRCIIPLYFLIFTFGCNQETPVLPEEENQYLTKTEFINTISSNSLKLFAKLAGFEEFSDLIIYDVDIYTIEYKTSLNGKHIAASGVIALPSGGNNDFPFVVANHGSISKHTEAPSENPNSSELVLMASTGYITIIPDYIGFGASKQYLHPYYIKEFTSSCVRDMILAAKEFSIDKKTPSNEKIFVFGYSEGGYVSMSTTESFENEGSIDLTATAAGAGGYNLERVMDVILEKDTYNSPSYLAYIIYSYHTYYDWNVPLDSMFNEPYASNIPVLFDGSKSLGEINNNLSFSLNTLFNPRFLDNLRNKSDTLLLPGLRINSTYDWVPETPIQLYHGTGDAIVPFLDSEETYNNFIAEGVTNTEFYPIPDEGHSTSLPFMISNVIPWFEAFNVDF